MSAYDPNSNDAVFSKILTRLEQQDKDAAARHIEIVGKFEDHEKRITTLEHEKWYQRGIVATIGFTITAAWHLITGRGN